jgi:hypothetical protein
VRHLHPTCFANPIAPSVTVRSMSSFTIPLDEDNGSGSVPVNSLNDLSKDDLLRFPAFQIWLSTLQRSLQRQHNPSHEFNHNPYVLRNINVQSVDYFKGGRLGFVKLKAEVSNGNGETLPGTVFLRGGSVGMLVRDNTSYLYYANQIIDHRDTCAIDDSPARRCAFIERG